MRVEEGSGDRGRLALEVRQEGLGRLNAQAQFGVGIVYHREQKALGIGARVGILLACRACRACRGAESSRSGFKLM